MKELRGKLQENESLAPYSSWHVGGFARQFYRPADIDDLAVFLPTLAKDEYLLWLGLGSNLLIRDGGIDGTVILTQGHLEKIEQLTANSIRAQAGVTCAKLAKYGAKLGLANAAFFAGVPGTVGGALAMNAGAFGGVTWTHVVAVETMDRQGVIRLRKPEEFTVLYREVKRPAEEWFVAGHFSFPLGDPVQAQEAIRKLLRQRALTQPIGEFSCGSVFRNPPNDHAARLIEASGLKGKKHGGAWVSEKHANFIINGGEATAADIETLIYLVQETVKKVHNVDLIPECHIVGQKVAI